MTERDWYKFLGDVPEGETVKFFQRVIATDGSNLTGSSPCTAPADENKRAS